MVVHRMLTYRIYAYVGLLGVVSSNYLAITNKLLPLSSLIATDNKCVNVSFFMGFAGIVGNKFTWVSNRVYNVMFIEIKYILALFMN